MSRIPLHITYLFGSNVFHAFGHTISIFSEVLGSDGRIFRGLLYIGKEKNNYNTFGLSIFKPFTG